LDAFCLPFNWPKAHQEACKQLPTNNGQAQDANNILAMCNSNYALVWKTTDRLT